MSSKFTVGIALAIGGGAAAKAMLGNVNSTLGKIGSTTKKLEARQDQLGHSIQKHMGTLAPASLRSLDRDYHKLGRTIDLLKRKELALQTQLAKRDRIRARRSELHGKVVETVAIGAAVAAPIKLAIDQESALSDLKKVTDFTDAEFARLSDDLMAMTRELPLAFDGLAAIGAAAGRMGLNTRETILQYVRDTAKTAVAFDLSEEDAGQRMAQLANAMQKPIDQAGLLAGKINLIGNNAALSESQLIDGMTRFGPIASTIKSLTDDMAFGMASVLIESGRQAEAGARALNSLTTKLSAAHVQPKRFKKALGQLKINPEEIAASMETNANSAIMLVLDRMKGLSQKDKVGLGSMLFGADFGDEALTLIDATGRIRELMALLEKRDSNGKLLSASSIDQEFNARLQTTRTQWRLTKNTLMEIGGAIGTTVLPVIKELLQEVRPSVVAAAQWVKENKALVGTIAKTVVALGALKVGMFAGAYGLNLLSGGANAVSIAFNLLSGKTTLVRTLLGMRKINGSGLLKLGKAAKWVGGIFATVGRALLLNPIGLIITGIAVAAYLIYKNWGKIKPFMINLWNGVKAKVGQAWVFIKGLFFRFTPLGILIRNWEPVTQFMGSLWSGVKSKATTAWSFIKNLFFMFSPLGLVIKNWQPLLTWFKGLSGKFSGFGRQMIAGLIGGIVDMKDKALEMIGSVAESIKNKFKNWLGINSPSRVFIGYGSNIGEGVAIGINNQVGQVAAVNKLLARTAANDDHFAAANVTPLPFKLPNRQQIQQAQAAAGGGVMQITFAPTIHLQGGPDTREQVRQGLDDGYREFERHMRRYERDMRRRSYA